MKQFPAQALLFAAALGSECKSDTELIKEAEKFSLCEFADTTIPHYGRKTVCYGFNLEDPDAKAEVEAVGGDYSDVFYGSCLSQDQCDKLFD